MQCGVCKTDTEKVCELLYLCGDIDNSKNLQVGESANTYDPLDKVTFLSRNGTMRDTKLNHNEERFRFFCADGTTSFVAATGDSNIVHSIGIACISLSSTRI